MAQQQPASEKNAIVPQRETQDIDNLWIDVPANEVQFHNAIGVVLSKTNWVVSLSLPTGQAGLAKIVFGFKMDFAMLSLTKIIPLDNKYLSLRIEWH